MIVSRQHFKGFLDRLQNLSSFFEGFPLQLVLLFVLSFVVVLPSVVLVTSLWTVLPAVIIITRLANNQCDEQEEKLILLVVPGSHRSFRATGKASLREKETGRLLLPSMKWVKSRYCIMESDSRLLYKG